MRFQIAQQKVNSTKLNKEKRELNAHYKHLETKTEEWKRDLAAENKQHEMTEAAQYRGGGGKRCARISLEAAQCPLRKERKQIKQLNYPINYQDNHKPCSYKIIL